MGIPGAVVIGDHIVELATSVFLDSLLPLLGYNPINQILDQNTGSLERRFRVLFLQDCRHARLHLSNRCRSGKPRHKTLPGAESFLDLRQL